MSFLLLKTTPAVEGFSPLLEQYIRKFKDAKTPEIFHDFRVGCENPNECSACAVEQKNCEWMIF